jgi:hypothetical protein
LILGQLSAIETTFVLVENFKVPSEKAKQRELGQIVADCCTQGFLNGTFGSENAVQAGESLT